MLKSSILISSALAAFRGLQLGRPAAKTPQNFAGGHIKDLEITLTNLKEGEKGNERIIILDFNSVPIECVGAKIERMVLEYGDEGLPEKSVIRVIHRSVHYEADLVQLAIDSEPTDSGISKNLINFLTVKLRSGDALKNLCKTMEMETSSRAPMSGITTGKAPWTVTAIQTPADVPDIEDLEDLPIEDLPIAGLILTHLTIHLKPHKQNSISSMDTPPNPQVIVQNAKGEIQGEAFIGKAIFSWGPKALSTQVADVIYIDGDRIIPCMIHGLKLETHTVGQKASDPKGHIRVLCEIMEALDATRPPSLPNGESEYQIQPNDKPLYLY